MENSTQHKLNNISTERFVSDTLANILYFINYASLGQAITIFGIITNTVSIVIFCRLGFKDTVNISLLGLTMSDLLSLITLMFFNIGRNPAFQNLNLSFDALAVMSLVASWPHVGFTRVTCGLTAFIALERCLCITSPLKVKSILTPRRVRLIVVMMFPLFFCVIPIYFTARLEWRFDPDRNRTILMLLYNDKAGVIGQILYIINTVVPVANFVIIGCCTVITVSQLRRRKKWRQSSAHAGGNTSVSEKDTRVGTLVVFISSIFIVCYFPSVVIFVWQNADPELNSGGQRQNLFRVLISFIYLFEAVNASVNIFVYLAMSSKYRDTFFSVWLRKGRAKKR